MEITNRPVEPAKVVLFEIMEHGTQIARGRLCVIHNDLHKEPFGLMEDVFVHEDHRGSGLGKKIIDAIIQMAKDAGCYKLIATSRTDRPKLHMYYKKLGFEIHGLEFRMDFN